MKTNFGFFFIVAVTSLCAVSQANEDFESFCSQLNSTKLQKIDLAKVVQGSLLSHKFREFPSELISDNLPITCKWLLQLESDGSEEAVGLTFDKFDIAETELSEELLDDDAANSFENVCAKDFVTIYEVNSSGKESTTNKMKAGYCGTGRLDSFQGAEGKSLIVEAKLTQPYRGFKIEFSGGPQVRAEEVNSCKREGYFQCSDTDALRCIPETFKCDGKSDCLEGGDEENCDDETADDRKNKAKDSGCGSPRRVSDVSGSIRSMGYENRNNYTDDAHCYWYITSPRGSHIFVTFNRDFSIQTSEGLNEDECNFDSLSLFTHDEAGQLSIVSRSCGKKAPNPVVVPGNALIVQFESDSHTNSRGFELFWKAVDPATGKLVKAEEPAIEAEASETTEDLLEDAGRLGFVDDTDVVVDIDEVSPSNDRGQQQQLGSQQRGGGAAQQQQQSRSKLHPACSSPKGVTLNAWSGMLSTPTPFSSGANVVCTWTIAPQMKAGQTQKKIEFRFYDFNTDPSQDCKQDVVEIVFFDDKNNKRRGRYSCGSRMPNFEEETTASTTKPVQVIFRPGRGNTFDLGYIVIATRQQKTLGGRPSAGGATSAVKPVVLAQQCGVGSVQPNLRARSFGGGSSNEMHQFTRIVGGEAAKPGSWPWAVELTFRNAHTCGATILNQYWLLTAAHCFKGPYHHQGGWQVVVGRHNIYSTASWDRKSPALYLRIRNIFIHKQYAKVMNSKEGDIAIVWLAEPITGHLATPACLPSRELRLTDTCYVTGWGDTKGTGNEGVLKQAAMPIISNDKCRNMQPTYLVQVKESMLCAGYEAGGIDACQGDSGGPLVCLVNNRWELHGVVSFGKGCAGRNAPGVYTRVTTYMPWIDKVISHYSRPRH